MSERNAAMHEIRFLVTEVAFSRCLDLLGRCHGILGSFRMYLAQLAISPVFVTVTIACSIPQ